MGYSKVILYIWKRVYSVCHTLLCPHHLSFTCLCKGVRYYDEVFANIYLWADFYVILMWENYILFLTDTPLHPR